MATIDRYFHQTIEQHASDLHLAAGEPPQLRVDGALRTIEADPLQPEALKTLLYEIAPAAKLKEFEETGDVDFCYELPASGARFRANYFSERKGPSAVFRLIPSKILTLEELGLPSILKKFALLPKGLVLVTGPTGSGKSTTLAAMVNHANQNRRDHIITIEDPIEFTHQSQQCKVSQREVGTNTRSFATALRGALREDPDVILVGELRDLETIELALTAAATGHLVLGTLHTSSAAKTIDRIIDVFPSGQQNQIRTTLAESLKGVIAQTLFKRIDQPGRLAVLEILPGNTAVANLIREGKTHQIAGQMETMKRLGAVILDTSIEHHYRAGRISAEEAYAKATDRRKFRALLSAQSPEFDD